MTKKSELSLMGQMKREAERDFNKFIKYVAELEKENKELKKYWSIEIKTCNRYREKCDELEKDNKELKEKLALTENDRDEWEVKTKDLLKENKELKEELQHYKNTEAIQKSNDASRWKPGCMSYVDRELNVIR